MNTTINVVWFKRDLRLQDHAPLCAAAESGNVVLLYIIEPELWVQPDSSLRHWHFLHDSLASLDAEILKNYNGKLIIRMGEAVSVFSSLRQELGNFTLWSHEETGNAWTYRRDLNIKQWCKECATDWHEFPANGMVRRLESRNGWSKIRDARMRESVIKSPSSIKFVSDISSDDLPAKNHMMFGRTLSNTTQKGGRSAAMSVLHSFIDARASRYMLTISKPGVSARYCSRLSTHIAYGTLSVREIETLTKEKIQYLSDDTSDHAKYMSRNLAAFLSRLAWRCHFVQKLEQQPSIETHCMHPAFEGMREPHFREDYFDAWKTGNTGYPLVDACMRSLIENGWINFRMRAMLVSFASYHLWLDWRQTAPYLAQLFTDYEPGIHYSQFQMQSGVTGINAVRMYNPIKQSQDHDPEGKFIRRYVPELVSVSQDFIHEPWLQGELEMDYPKPIVEHIDAIRYARGQLSEFRKKAGFVEQAKGVHQKLGSRNRSRSRAKKKPAAESKQMQFKWE